MNQTPPTIPNAKVDPDQVTRIIMLIYGKMEDGGAFWCYVAVKPSKFDLFQADQAAGKIDLYAFDAYGEVIVSGVGSTPPDDVTLKVAEMYGADASTFFQPMDPTKAVDEKLKEWEENPPKN
jgi:hypothetical protein